MIKVFDRPLQDWSLHCILKLPLFTRAFLPVLESQKVPFPALWRYRRCWYVHCPALNARFCNRPDLNYILLLSFRPQRYAIKYKIQNIIINNEYNSVVLLVLVNIVRIWWYFDLIECVNGLKINILSFSEQSLRSKNVSFS